MREIKFRVWARQTRDMAYRFPYILGEDGEAFVLPSSSDFILMQYTGLKDKNSTEIYEGDIVQSPETLANGKYISQVTWESLRAGFYLPNMFGSGLCNIPILELGGIQANNLTVIGNIYENPALVEETPDDSNNLRRRRRPTLKARF